jgi:UDP-GlcNAc:undecaprenyl-phosphate GlcNAc-1-phosphate transferase
VTVPPWLAAVALSLAVSWAFCRILIRWAPRLGLVDQPDPSRKVHRAPTPRAGGLGIAAGVTAGAGLLCVLDPSSRPAAGEWLWCVPVVVLGYLDDRRPLPWQLRLGVQALLAAAAVRAFFPDLPAPAAVWHALAVVWVVGLVNAFNMIDNMDLLSAGTAWVTAGGLALTAALSGGRPEAFLVLLGALTGFLWHNRPPARLFMGDSGSTFLGFFLGLSTLRPALDPPASVWWAWAVPVCLTAVPWYDLVTVVALRLRQGRSPFHADKQHLSHRLAAAGMAPPAAVGTIHLLALASGLTGLVLYQTSDAPVAALALAQLAAWWAAVALVDRRITRRLFLVNEQPEATPTGDRGNTTGERGA